jgi:hypothetical protein
MNSFLLKAQIKHKRIGDCIEYVRNKGKERRKENKGSCRAEVRAVMSSCDEGAMWDEISTAWPGLSAEAPVTDRIHSHATAATKLLYQAR